MTTHKDPPTFREGRRSYQLLAFVCTLLLSAGCDYSTNSLQPLKADFKRDFPLTNGQFGTLLSSSPLINSIIPLFGGVLMDRFGTGVGSVVCTTLIACGSGLTAVGAAYRLYPVSVVARVVFGLGAGTVMVAQESILSRAFHGRGLAVSLGLHLSLSRGVAFMAHGTAIPLRGILGGYVGVLWVGFGLSVVSLVFNLAYVVAVAGGGREAAARRPFSLHGIIFMPPTYWLIPLTIALLSAVWVPVLSMAPEYIGGRYGKSDEKAGWTSASILALPVVLSPFCGYVFDRYGHRGPALIGSALLLSVSLALLGWSELHPVVPLLMLSLSYALAPVALVTAVALVLPPGQLGTGLGMYKCAHTSATALLHLVIGMLQDRDGGGYGRAVSLLLVISMMGCMSAVGLWLSDGVCLRGLLDAGVERRERLLRNRREAEEKDQVAGVPREWRVVSIIGATVLLLLSATCWGLNGGYVTGWYAPR